MKGMSQQFGLNCLPFVRMLATRTYVNLVNEQMLFGKNDSIMRAELRLTSSKYGTLR